MGKKSLDLGCGVKKRDCAVGVDIMPNKGVDIVHDLNIYPYPFSDNEFDDILFDNSLGHLDSIVKTMEEVWRISKPGAKVTIKAPYFRSHYAVDPTLIHRFASHSFYYFDPEHMYHKYYKYSDKAFFHTERVFFDKAYKYSLFRRPVLFFMRWFADRYAPRYEEYLAHLFPLHGITYYLRAIK